MLGHFLELSVPTTNIIDSLGFYRSLGFQELEIGEMWPHKYAVVSDGELCIGLHDGKFESPAVTFVHQDLAREARSMLDHGFDFKCLKVDEDEFNELAFVDLDGHHVTMIEARTFTPVDENTDNSLCGRWFELSLPAKDALRAGRFWAPLAPELLRMREEPTTHMRFNAAGISLGLSESIALTGPSLCFRCDDREAVWIALAKDGCEHHEFPGYEGAFMALKAPEGTMLFLFEEDFLGELYEVSEGED
jgi:hypothetical protein